MTLGIYAKVIASGTDHGATLDDLVAGSFRHSNGTGASFGLIPPRVPTSMEARTPAVAGVPKKRLMGFEPTTFCMASAGLRLSSAALRRLRA